MPDPFVIALYTDPPQLIAQFHCYGFPDYSRLFGRLTNGTTQQSRLFRPCELRIPCVNTEHAFCWVNDEFANWGGLLENVTIANGDFIGMQFTALSHEYLARPPRFIPLISVPFP